MKESVRLLTFCCHQKDKLEVAFLAPMSENWCLEILHTHKKVHADVMLIFLYLQCVWSLYFLVYVLALLVLSNTQSPRLFTEFANGYHTYECSNTLHNSFHLSVANYIWTMHYIFVSLASSKQCSIYLHPCFCPLCGFTCWTWAFLFTVKCIHMDAVFYDFVRT